jgi:hypothetical protein
MKLNALLMSQDRPSLRVLEALLDVLQIEHQTCQSAGEAVELTVHGHHWALMLDSVRLLRWAERSNRG